MRGVEGMVRVRGCGGGVACMVPKDLARIWNTCSTKANLSIFDCLFHSGTKSNEFIISHTSNSKLQLLFACPEI